jgi:membrane-bound lytic murein transglycosylase D
MGYGALLRSMRKYGTNDFWRLSRLEAALPYETNLYVAKVMACAIVGRNLERLGLGDLRREGALSWDEVEVPAGTTLAQVARASESTIDELRRLNPALRRDRTPPGRALSTVRVPGGHGATFTERWPRVRPGRPAHSPYLVRQGEDLATVAHRFRTTEAALRELNALAETDVVRPGFDLMVPAVAPREPSFETPPVVVVPARTFTYEGRRRVFYRVTRGDRLAEIARFFGVSFAEVRQWNEVDPRATLQDGLFLQLFVPSDFDTSRAVVMTPDEVQVLVMGSEEFYEHHVRQEGRVRLRYRVREGDSLSTIANRFGLSVGSVCRINVMPRDAVLAIGQEIIVYTSGDRVPAEMRGQIEPEPETPAAVDASEPTPEAAPEAPPDAEPDGEPDAATEPAPEAEPEAGATSVDNVPVAAE